MSAARSPDPQPAPLTCSQSADRHSGAALARRYREVRRATERLCEPLEIEDYVAQSMPDASPAKWHLAHTTWFFERMVLAAATADYQPVDERYYFLFNSYYNALGDRHARPKRGLLTRPTVQASLGAARDGAGRRCAGELPIGQRHRDRTTPRATAPGIVADGPQTPAELQFALACLSPA